MPEDGSFVRVGRYFAITSLNIQINCYQGGSHNEKLMVHPIETFYQCLTLHEQREKQTDLPIS